MAAVIPFIIANWVQIAIMVVSMVVQQQAAAAARARQAAAQAEAAARADAAKGTSVVTEGQSAPIRVLYGRNLVGGVRVYHNTSNTYNYSPPAQGGVLFAASPNAPSLVVSYFPDLSAWYDIFAQGAHSVASFVNYSLGASIGGAKHEFLYTQQAICYGGINACYQVDVDDRLFDSAEYVYGQRIHVYLDGGIADPLMVANDAGRSTALFTNTAYATGVFRLNRDQPQYNGVPTLKFYVEGLKVSSLVLVAGTWKMSAIKAYSNNPVLVLLDYLTNTVYGRGLAVESIDLNSFKVAFDICETVVLPSVPSEGKFWKARARGAAHSVKLYECNIGLDTTKSIRENTDLILGTMGTAELIWSSGKYKLNAIYPTVYTSAKTYAVGDIVQYTVNGNVDLFHCISAVTGIVPVEGVYWSRNAVAAYITDDTLVRATPNNVSWPNAQSRLNYCTVKFLNESQDFVEDSASWPPKTGTVDGPQIDRGAWVAATGYGKSDIVSYGGAKYQLKTGIVRVDGAQVDRGVWSPGDGSYPLPAVVNGAWEMTWQQPMDANGVAHFQARSGIIYPAGSLVSFRTYNAVIPAPARWSYPIYTQYQANQDIYYNANTSPVGNSAWTLFIGNGRVNSTPPNLDSAWIPYANNSVYNIYRAEDSGLPLETEAFETGCSDYYHALASAEQRVRSSRANVTYELSLDRSLFALEPGDLIKVNSVVLGIPGELLRVDTVKVGKEGSIDISATKYDAANLAWNANDNEVVAQRNIYDFSLSQVTQSSITLDTSSTSSYLGTGFLRWDPAPDVRVSMYEVKYTTAPLLSINANTVWQSLGLTATTMLELPYIATGSYVVAIVAKGIGKAAAQSGWPLYFVDVGRFSVPSVDTVTGSLVNDGIQLNWVPHSTMRVASYELRVGAIWSTATILQSNILPTSLKLSRMAAGTYNFMVKAFDLYGNTSTNPASVSIVVTPPAAMVIRAEFVGIDAVFSWDASQAPFGVDRYEILNMAGAVVSTTKSTQYRMPVTSTSSVLLQFRAVDLFGNLGATSSSSLIYSAPSAPVNFVAKVIDNNVLFSWLLPPSTLPVVTYRLYKGATFAGATLIGEKSGLFTLVFEQLGGGYTYWLTAVDSAGGVSAPASVPVNVNQPADYQLIADFNSTFTGASVNGFLEHGSLLLPLNLTDTFAQHFVNNAWATPAAQIAAGMPIYGQPATLLGSYSEVIDYGVVLAGCTVSVALATLIASGAPTHSIDMSYKTLLTDAWTTLPNTAAAYITNFRYVKIDITVASSGVDMMELTGLNVRLDSKIKGDSGTVACGVESTTALTSLSNGAPCVATRNAHGLTNGTCVVLTTTGTLPAGLALATDYFVVASALNTFSLSATIGGAPIATTTSGTGAHSYTLEKDGTLVKFNQAFYDIISVTTSPNGIVPLAALYNFVDVPNPTHMKVLLFDAANNRVAGNVSWAVKGY